MKPVSIPDRPRGLKFDAYALADPRFEVKAEAATISIFDVIGLDVTTARVAGALRSIGPKPVTVEINSPGGDPFTGLAVFNLLRGHGQKITTRVLGLAASAASLIAMAGDRIEMARASSIMIHRSAGGAMGTADDMRAMATALDAVDATMRDLYAARTGVPAEQIAGMMAAETWLPPADAIALGFADGLLERDAMPAPARASAPSSKRQLDAAFQALGFSRSEARRMTAAAWHVKEKDPEAIDLAAVAAALTGHYATQKPYLTKIG